MREHHAARLNEALDALVEPRTAAELVPVLFRRELDSHQLSFAVGEALAHLRFLEDEGRAAHLVDEDVSVDFSEVTTPNDRVKYRV